MTFSPWMQIKNHTSWVYDSFRNAWFFVSSPTCPGTARHRWFGGMPLRDRAIADWRYWSPWWWSHCPSRIASNRSSPSDGWFRSISWKGAPRKEKLTGKTNRKFEEMQYPKLEETWTNLVDEFLLIELFKHRSIKSDSEVGGETAFVDSEQHISCLKR